MSRGNLQEDSFLAALPNANMVQSSQHFDFSLWAQNQRTSLGHAWTWNLQKLWDKYMQTGLSYWIYGNLYGNLLFRDRKLT